MNHYKIILFFTQGNAGWSETYYHDDVDATAGLSTMLTLVRNRNGLICGRGVVKMVAARLSDDTVSGDATLRENLPPPADGPVFNNPVAEVFCSALCRMEATPLYRRQLMVRGIPADLALDAAIIDIVPEYASAMTVFMAFLVTNQYRVRHIDKSLFNSAISITNVVAGPQDGQWVLTLAAPFASLNKGDHVMVTAIREMPWLQGRHVAINVAGLAVTIQLREIHTLQPYLGTGTMRRVLFSYDTLTSAFFERFTHRITGLPFGRPVGRRKRPSR
jgi:hypothetical protein